MSDLNEDLLQQLEDGAAAMGLETTEDGGVIEMHQGGEMGDQELVEEVITEEGTHLGHEDQDIIVETDTSAVDSVHDLITLHGVEEQADLMDSAEQMGIQMDQASMDQMMDTSNIVEEVITSTQAQEDSLMEQSMQQQFVEEQVFNPETGTLQPLSSLNAQKPAEPEPPKPAPVKKPVTKQVKYFIAQPQGEGGSQGGPILLDASQLQGLMNAGVVKAGQNIILPAAKKAIKSPAKILPAPIPVGDQQQPSNSPKFIMKSGSILAPLTGGIPGGKVLQIGSGSQVRYVQLVPRKSVPTNKIPIAPAKPKAVAPRPAGQTIILPAGDLNQSLSNFVVMPGGIMLKQETTSTTIPIRQNTSISDQLEASILTNVNQTQSSGQYDSFRSLLEPNGMRPRKPCNCTKSQCLKLYCDCFANGEFCNLCNCTNCFNNLQHEEDRQKAIKLVLERNPGAFRPKIGKSSSTGEAHERRHNKGCNCRRSGCLKNYCECYEAKIFCSGICKCTGCKNCIENIPTGLPNGVGVEQHFAGAGTSHRQTLKDLAEAAEVRVQQQTQVKNKMRAQMQEVIPQNNLGVMVPPLVFRYPQGSISYEVVTSTVELLLARAEAAERAKLPEGEVERAILEEFGDCLASVMELGSTIVDNNP